MKFEGTLKLLKYSEYTQDDLVIKSPFNIKLKFKLKSLTEALLIKKHLGHLLSIECTHIISWGNTWPQLLLILLSLSDII